MDEDNSKPVSLLIIAAETSAAIAALLELMGGGELAYAFLAQTMVRLLWVLYSGAIGAALSAIAFLLSLIAALVLSADNRRGLLFSLIFSLCTFSIGVFIVWTVFGIWASC